MKHLVEEKNKIDIPDEYYHEAVRIMKLFSNYGNIRIIREESYACIDEIVSALKAHSVSNKHLIKYEKIKETINYL